MGISKVTRNCQITLPKDIRKIIGVKEGDEVIFAIENDNVRLIKAKKDIIKATAGLWKEIKGTGAEYQTKIRAGWKKRRREMEW